jgi:hypothetical protein
VLFKGCAVLEDALSWARHLERAGRIPLLIDALRVGMREQLGA